ncbi:ricin-type beta-trefoil lectin domain protein [Cellulomonas sp. HZM]|uniref:ricin-type beta-trefoil lectin domain protein n=1 Tax=Cellulomonas sp. HZM TaxID=1454010 RepID=UPI0018CC7983|nr:ricin-type beta-trefoil lectin domain protein [Cellulomonas sp. HZM]
MAAAAGAALVATPAQAAGETVNVWLTTTSDAGGRTVTRGLQQQGSVTFGSGTGSSGQTITVNDGTRFQTFTGAGASFTDTAAWLIDEQLSASAKDAAMQKLFSTSSGIGMSLLRNTIGSSDLARGDYSYSETADPSLANFTLSHDLADVVPLTKQALSINPGITVVGSPWSAPGWMKDNGSMHGGHLQAKYYGTYATYFVKYIQQMAAQGIKVGFVTPQNEPGVNRGDMPSMGWDANGLDYFVGSELLPKLHAAGLSTKVLVHDWNPSDYDGTSAQTVNDAAIRNDSLFGGIGWHNYGGSLDKITQVHDQYPNVDAYGTEISGGTWVGNQQQNDMLDIVNYTRNWAKSFTKWSIAVDRNHGPHNGGCDTCTGLLTVHDGQADPTIEYYTMGHLTKFVRPGAVRVDSTANGAVPNVAFVNPDGSHALVGYNDSGTSQQVTVNWNGGTFTYTLPAQTSVTFTWGAGGTTTPPPTTTPPATPAGSLVGIGGKCVTTVGGSSANGTRVELRPCNGSAAQRWTASADGTLRVQGKCLDVVDVGTANGTRVQVWDCHAGPNQRWTSTGGKLVVASSGRCLDAVDNSSADGTPLQIWDCFGGANQLWALKS